MLASSLRDFVMALRVRASARLSETPHLFPPPALRLTDVAGKASTVAAFDVSASALKFKMPKMADGVAAFEVRRRTEPAFAHRLHIHRGGPD